MSAAEPGPQRRSALEQILEEEALGKAIDRLLLRRLWRHVRPYGWQVIATLLQMHAGAVHPTINQDETDPEIDVDVVPNVAKAWPIRVALSNSFGFGGLNATVVVGRTP